MVSKDELLVMLFSTKNFFFEVLKCLDVIWSSFAYLKGVWDFRLQVFFMNQFSPGPARKTICVGTFCWLARGRGRWRHWRSWGNDCWTPSPSLVTSPTALTELIIKTAFCNMARNWLSNNGETIRRRLTSVQARELQRDVYLSWPIVFSYMSPNAGGGGRELRRFGQWVRLYTEAQINFRDLTPYLTYGSNWLFFCFKNIYIKSKTVGMMKMLLEMNRFG
jgi:hypothetical protein